MSWDPLSARKSLDSISGLMFIREVKKISAFQFENGRQLALSEENSLKVSLYLSRAPYNLDGVVVEKKYLPTEAREGRHADLEALASSLGYSHKIYRVTVASETALNTLCNWYSLS